MKILLPVLAAAVLLSACSVDLQRALERRTALIEGVFPDLADRQGIYLVFPLESDGYVSTMEVAFFPQEVSEATVRRRVGSFCARQSNSGFTGQAAVKKDLGPNTRTLGDGTTKSTRTIYYSCVTKA